MNILMILSIIGFFISSYAFFVKQKIKKTPNYKSFCDLSDVVSCTKPMKSPYANLFYFSYSVFGIFYYILIFILAILNLHKLLLISSIIGIIGTIIFAYILYFKIKSLCILCTSLYIINILIFVIAIKNYI